MAEFQDRVIALSRAAWRLRRAARKPCDLPFALALFSDEKRLPDILGAARALPKGEPPIAVIFRHDGLGPQTRKELALEVMSACRETGHLFLMARADLEGADGAHAHGGGAGSRTAPVHDEAELAEATLWADAAFLSPIFPTLSHPDTKGLGRARAVALAQAARLPVFALGGMTPAGAAELEGTDFQGLGAIGAFTG